MITMPKRFLLILTIAIYLPAQFGFAAEDWQRTLNQAKGETVYMNAWGGSETINSYLHWAAQQVKQRYDITLHHIKVDDVSSIVSRMVAEKGVNRDDSGTIDLLWINGENFKTLNDHSMLYGPFVQKLPNWRYVDPVEKPTTVVDFGQPTDGMEAPWGMAQLVFIYDAESVDKPPRSMTELLQFAQKNPGVFTYPGPPDFVGSTFLKQALIEITNNSKQLQQPVGENFDSITKPLWQFLDKLHPHLWRQGRTFPASSTAMLPLLDDGETAFALSLNPNEGIAAVNSGLLPKNIRTYIPAKGSIGNSHFLAIPWNSSAKAAAKVVVNFLMSPEAQLHKADTAIWGDPTILSLKKLPDGQRQAFEAFGNHPNGISNEHQGPALPEPHVSWMNALEQAWLKRYRG